MNNCKGSIFQGTTKFKNNTRPSPYSSKSQTLNFRKS